MATAEREYWRLFVAIPVPAEVKTKIQRTQSLIRQRLPGDAINWTRPEQFHLTLKFLGDVPSDSVPAISDALRTVAVEFRPVALQSRGLGFFPNARVPRVLWAGVTDGSGQLNDLQLKIEAACTDFGTEPTEDRFHAHVTLARVKRFRGGIGDDLGKAVLPDLENDFGRWTATHVELIRSQLFSSGPAYTTLAELPMAKA